MALISTFELLRAPQLPRAITERNPALKPLARTFIQGYFLSVANLFSEQVFYSLIVRPSSPINQKDFVLSLLNTFAGAEPVSERLGIDGSLRYDFNIDAGETGLIILIPDLLSQKLPDPYGLRGTVELFLRPDTADGEPSSVPVLLNAEHRSTYFDDSLTAIGEVASGISLAEGRGLIDVEVLTDWSAKN